MYTMCVYMRVFSHGFELYTVCICAFMYVGVCICVHICIIGCMYVCIYIHAHVLSYYYVHLNAHVLKPYTHNTGEIDLQHESHYVFITYVHMHIGTMEQQRRYLIPAAAAA